VRGEGKEGNLYANVMRGMGGVRKVWGEWIRCGRSVCSPMYVVYRTISGLICRPIYGEYTVCYHSMLYVVPAHCSDPRCAYNWASVHT
jgi:hypothetical protein